MTDRDIVALEVLKKCMDRKRKERIDDELIDAMVHTSFSIASAFIKERMNYGEEKL